MTLYSEVVADSPFLFLRFENAAALTTKDAAGTATQTVNSANLTSVTGVDGLGVGYAGTGSYLSINTSTDGLFNPRNAFTFETWYKRTAGGDSVKTLLYKAGSAAGIALRIGSSAGDANYPANTLVFETADSSFVWTRTAASAAINDTNWHHVVLTSDATTLKLYLDGTQVGSRAVPATFNTSSFATAFFGAAATTGTSLNGSLDELVAYKTALSPTRITAHFNAGYVPATTNVSGSFGTAAGTGAAPVQTATAAQNLPGVNQSIGLLEVASYNGSTGVTTVGQLSLKSAINSVAKLRFDLASLPAGASISSATLRLTRSNTTSFAAQVRKAESYSGTSYSSTPSVSFTPGATNTIDVTAVLNALTDRQNGGLFLTTSSTAQTTIDWYATGQDAPTLTVTYSVPATGAFGTAHLTGAAVSVSANSGTRVSFETAAGTGSAATPGVVTGTGTSAAWGAATAALSGTTWVGSTEFVPDTVGVFGTAGANGAAGVLWSFHETASFGSAAATGAAGGVTASTVYRIIAAFGAARGIAKAPSPLQVNPTADPYYQAILTSLTSPYDVWYSMDIPADDFLIPEVNYDLTGTPVGQYGPDAPILGSVHFDVEGPEGRKAMHVTAGYVDATDEPDDTEIWSAELVFRTSKKDGTLYFGRTTDAGQSRVTFVELVNGRIRIANYSPTVSAAQRAEFIGRLDVADGQWHHVVISRNPMEQLEIFVDGQLDIRRQTYVAPGAAIGFTPALIAQPDYYFGGPTSMRLPQFVGDVMEIVFRAESGMTPERARAHSNAVFGINNNYFMTARGTAKAASWIGSGNVPMALALHFGGVVKETGWNVVTGDYDFTPGLKVGDRKYGNYQVEWLDVSGLAFIDEITGDPRFRDLDKEADLAKYDMVFFPWYPDESNEGDFWFDTSAGIGGGVSMIDRDNAYFRMRLLEMLGTLRTAIDKHGTSLLIQSPTLAADMGIIDRVEFVPSMEELSDPNLRSRQGAAEPAYNPHGADIDPWGNPTGEPGKNVNVGDSGLSADYYYWDSHQNNRFRVRNLMPGLTDVPAWILTDFTEQWPHRQFMVEHGSKKYVDRTEHGLEVGDEFIFEGPRTSGWMYPSSSYSANPYDRVYGTWAVPSQNVKAGTVITTYVENVWQGRTETVNPYRNYATSIAVRPGETLQGKPLGGKIFVNFTEKILGEDKLDSVIKQLPPESVGETAEQKKWQYSDWRRTTSKTEAGSGSVTVGLPTGGTAGAPASQQVLGGEFTYKTNNDTKLFMITVVELYATELIGWRASMLVRGLLWLADNAEVAAGQVVAHWAPAKVTAKADGWTTTAGKSEHAAWGTARVQAYANIGTNPGTRGFFGTATARANAVIGVAIRFGTAGAVGSANIAHFVDIDATEVLTLYVETGQVTLYVEEE